MNLVDRLNVGTVGVSQPLADQIDGQICNVNADPLPAKFLGSINGGAAPAERVQNNVTFTTRGRDDALQQSKRLLSRISKSFARTGVNGVNICPDILQSHAGVVAQV